MVESRQIDLMGSRLIGGEQQKASGNPFTQASLSMVIRRSNGFSVLKNRRYGATSHHHQPHVHHRRPSGSKHTFCGIGARGFLRLRRAECRASSGFAICVHVKRRHTSNRLLGFASFASGDLGFHLNRNATFHSQLTHMAMLPPPSLPTL